MSSQTCPVCSGQGYILVWEKDIWKEDVAVPRECDQCNGRGEVEDA